MTSEQIKARCEQVAYSIKTRIVNDELPDYVEASTVKELESLCREMLAKGLEMAADGLTNDVRLDNGGEVRDNEVGKDGDGTSYNQGIDMCITWCREQANTLKEPT